MRILFSYIFVSALLSAIFAMPVVEERQVGPASKGKPKPVPIFHPPPKPKFRPVTVTGKIRCSNADTRKDLGYLAAEQNIFGEYYKLQKRAGGALTASFSFTPQLGKSSYSQIDLKGFNSPGGFPYVAGAVSFSGTTDGIGSGVYSTGIFVGSKKTTPKGSKPVTGKTTVPGTLQPKVETAIWTYNALSKALTATWVNPDGSRPNAILAYYNEKFGFTGDIASLAANYEVQRLSCKIA